MTVLDPQVCFECGASATQNHHVIPRVAGGMKTVPLCDKCHNLAHNVAKRGEHRALVRLGKSAARAVQPTDVLDYLALGFKLGEVAAIVGASPSTVSRLAKKRGWSRRRGGQPVPPAVAEMRRRGATLAEIAKHLGCSTTQAWKIANGHPVGARKAPRRRRRGSDWRVAEQAA